MRRNRSHLACAYGRTVVHIPRLGIAHLAYVSCLDLVDGSYDVRPRTPLVSHLDNLSIFYCSADEQFVLGRIMTGRLFEIDVLSGLHSHNGSLCVPMVRHGDYRCIEFVGLEHPADIRLSLREFSRKSLDLLAATLKSLIIKSADVVRHALVQQIINAYEKAAEKPKVSKPSNHFQGKYQRKR